MSTRDPFLRSILVLVDRAIVFVVLAAIAFGLLWVAASRKALGLSGVKPVSVLWRMVSKHVSPTEAVIAALCACLALTSTSIVAYSLFRLWRRRALLVTWPVRGPTIHD
jgi:hypothetical protein